jgi:hypothetical protein
MKRKGVTPAITTPWNENLSVDHAFLAEHSRWPLEMGSTRVRRPRLELIGEELEQAKHIIREALRARPEPVGSYALPNWK